MPVLVWVALIAAGAVCLGVLFFYRILSKRDQYYKPNERVYGVGFKKALLIYQPSNRGSNHLVAQILAKALAQTGYTVTVNHPSRRLA